MLRSVRQSAVGVVFALLVWLVAVPCLAAADKAAKVYVVLWWDTEDYILPADDDATLRLAEFLSREKIRATFKLVGEKARTLERRGRTDVIAALKKHDIGYHSNYHSVQPTPAMYLSNLGWDEGVSEFDRREGPGRDDVQRIFGVAPSCYGQPGSSWGPQSYGAMRKWGMPVYLDAGSHVNLDDKPCYYCGILNLYKLRYTLRTGLGGPKDLKEAEDRFAAARRNLLDEGGGIVSIFYHPCEFVHKEFWDGVNFRNGANPPREKWKLPPTKTAEESRIAYQTFEDWIRFIKRFPEVQFITATEVAKVYRDKTRGRKFTPAELKDVAQAITENVSFQRQGDCALATSEVFALLNDYVVERAAGREPTSIELKATPFGPSNPVTTLTELVTTDWSQFSRTAVDVADYVRKQGRIPTSVWLGSVVVPPESYLVALAHVASALLDGKPAPETIEVKPARLAAAKYVADDAPNLWGWVIFPRGFRAPAMMELAKRQAWTLKPAILPAAQN
ncbi:MAG TPA: hypothetical protein VKI65_06005 [Gemmataceae bacterium]|nr:hypothetical protein [Gemmataceae bacterium]